MVVVQKLFTPLWLRQLYKVCDLVLFIPANFTFWNKSMFKPLCLGFCFPFWIIVHGRSGEHLNFSRWVGKCTKCAKKITWTQGIFCVNFCVSREGYPLCQGSSCGCCFSLVGKTSFPIKTEDYKTNENSSARDVQRLELAWKEKHRKETISFKQETGTIYWYLTSVHCVCFAS